MKELQLTVRISMQGEYIETEKYHISIPEDTSEDKEMETMMTELYPLVKDEYGDSDEWEGGDITWDLDTWETI
jgi:hypothetical protein